MKSSEERLREAAKHAWGIIHDAYDQPIVDDDRDEALEVLDDALSASKTTDLERLVEWLKERMAEADIALQLMGETDKHEGKRRQMHGTAWAFCDTLKHIADEFGVGEGE